MEITGPVLADVAAVLFDMDGTLVDSEHVSDRCWAAWCARRAKPLPEVLSLSRGRQAVDVMRLAAPELDDAVLAEDAAEFVAAELADTDGVVAMPGAARLMERLAALAVPSALVTSAIAPLARVRMAAAGLPLPVITVCGDEVARGKPAPDGYLAAARGLAVSPVDCVVIEDAVSGIVAGRAAGARVVAVGDVTHAAVDAYALSLDLVQAVAGEDPNRCHLHL